MKNSWVKMLSVLLIGLMCFSLSACQSSEEKAEEGSDAEIVVESVEEDETDEIPVLEEDMAVDTDPITEQDVIEESTATYDEEFLGAEESEMDEIGADSFTEMEEPETDSSSDSEDEQVENAE